MPAERSRKHGTGVEVVDVPRFYVHPAYVRAMPPAARGRLVNVLNALMTLAEAAGERLVVRASRAAVAELAGISEQSAKRLERELQGLGIVRQLAHGVSSRDVEILAPPTVPLRPIRTLAGDEQGVTGDPLPTRPVAIRAVDNSPPDQHEGVTGDPLQGVTGDPLPSRSTSSLDSERIRESRRACARERRGEVHRREPQVDFAKTRAGELGLELQERLERAGAGAAYRLNRTQLAGVRSAIQRRIEALVRSGAGEAQAGELARRDLERVLGYALKAERPAAHLGSALRRDWHSHLVEGSEAAAVKARGAKAERPVEDLDSRQGLALRPCADLDAEDDAEVGPDLERALERFRRAVTNAPLSRSQREQLRALTPRSAGEALELAVALERAAVAAQVKTP